MGKNAGLIYRSFVDAVRLLDNDTQLEAINAYFDYLMDEVEYDGENAIVKALMLMSYPTIDSTQKKYEARCENGKKGGRPKTKSKPNENLTETEKNLNETEAEPNINLKVEVEEEVEVEDKEEVEEEDDVEEDIQNAPACAREVPIDFIAEIKKRVIEDGEISTLAQNRWIDPARIVQDSDNVYVCSKPKLAVQVIREKYGGLFEDAIRAANPDFKGNIVFAIA